MTGMHWRHGTVTMWLKSGQVLTFDGDARAVIDADAAVVDYETRGGPEFILLPNIGNVDVISITPSGDDE